MALPGSFSSPYVYEFVNTPNAVLASAFPEISVIDVEARGENVRYKGETGSGVVLDPVMLAAEAGKTYSTVSRALTEAEIAKNAGKAAAEVARESSKVVKEVTKVVNAKSTGSALGGEHIIHAVSACCVTQFEPTCSVCYCSHVSR
jgi:hypothetical protein